APVITKAHKVTREPGVMNCNSGTCLLSSPPNVDSSDRIMSPPKFAVSCARSLKNFAANHPAFSSPASSQPIAISQPNPDESVHHIPSTRQARKRALFPVFVVGGIYFSHGSKNAS